MAEQRKAEMTLDDLKKSTLRLRPQKAPSPGKITISNIKLLPRQKAIMVHSQVFGDTGLYNATIAFYKSKFGAKKDDIHTLPVETESGPMFIAQLSERGNPVQVKCTCTDFKFTWEYFNHKNHALIGRQHTPYVRKTTTYPERNPKHIPGLCKHLLALMDELDARNLLVR